MIRQTQLSYILLVLATSYGLGRPSSGQNIHKNLNTSLHNVLFVNVMGSHLQSYSSLIVNACSSCAVCGKCDRYCTYIVKILKLIILIVKLFIQGYTI
jgi:hypothetical protein